MARFVVLEPPPGRTDSDVVLVRDRFHWLALLFPLPWLLYHRLWIATLAYLAAVAALTLLSHYAGAGMLQWSLLLVALLVALEGPAWRVAKLRRAGYAETGAIQADTVDDAERILAGHGMHRSALPDGVPALKAATPADRAWRDSRSLFDPIGR